MADPVLASPLISPITPKSKRKQITVKEKITILNMLESGQKITNVAEIFGISKSTASSILKEKRRIRLLHDHYKFDPGRKRIRLGLFQDINEAVGMWFKQAKSKNEPVTGPILQQKAKDFAMLLGHDTFKASSGWLFRFRERFDITTIKMSEINNTEGMSGVGMTDEEIAESVRQNHYTEEVKEKDFLPNLYPDCVMAEDIADAVYPNHSLKDSDKDEKTSIDPSFNDCNGSRYEERHPDCTLPQADFSVHYPDSYSEDFYHTPNSIIGEHNDSDNSCRVTPQQAISLVNKLTHFIHLQENVPKEVKESIDIVDKYISVDLLQQLQQRKITDYFKTNIIK